MSEIAEINQDQLSSDSETGSTGTDRAQQSSRSDDSATLDTVSSEDDPPDLSKGYKTSDRELIFEEDIVIKKELAESDWARVNGDSMTRSSWRAKGKSCDQIVKPLWARERLMNDFATLRFVAAHTTIPVPKCRLYDDENGLLCLEMERIKGVVELDEIQEPQERATMARQIVEKELNESVLPQLRSLRRNFVGSVDPDLPMFPPSRVYHSDRRSWPHTSSTTDSYVLCHNDLAPQNILVHPETFKIVSIIDWEFAGFYPSYFEIPIWRRIYIGEIYDIYEATEDQELAFFGIRSRDDLEDNRYLDAPDGKYTGKRWGISH
ncbi:hypothetical protein MBLNU457_6285t1 [Dothideomycetes sp. NU457]